MLISLHRLGGGTGYSFDCDAYLTLQLLAAGTNLELAQCPSSGAGGINACYAAFLGLHITPGSTAYLEVIVCYLLFHSSI